MSHPLVLAMAEADTDRLTESKEDDPSEQKKQDVKQLKARIQALKKSASKGDKKKRKEVNIEIARLEEEIQKIRKSNSTSEDCLQETRNNQSRNEGGDDTGIVQRMEDVAIKEDVKEGKNKLSKAQRKRVSKAHAAREREERITQRSIREEETLWHQEKSKLLLLLEPLRLTIKEITPDGNCLYAALSDQLLQRVGLRVGAQELREKCANHVRLHHDDFAPYITNPDTGDLCTPEDFEEYCCEIENPSVWGGHIEVVALSHVYKCPITVHQAYATPIIIGEEYTSNEMLHISYHQHQFTLGKHYNSVVVNSKSD